MSDDNTQNTNDQSAELGDDDLPKVSELDALKVRADALGITYHPSIGVDKLREKVNNALNNETPAEKSTAEAPITGTASNVGSAVGVSIDTPTALAPLEPIAEFMRVLEPVDPEVILENETPAERRYRKKKEANELLRVRIQCMDPAKKDWDGQLFTAGNSLVGSFTKYVPFGNDEGWHVPRIILNQIQQAQCQIFTTTKDKLGNNVKTSKMIKAFAVEIMPNLTVDELQALAQRQAMAKGE